MDMLVIQYKVLGLGRDWDCGRPACSAGTGTAVPGLAQGLSRDWDCSPEDEWGTVDCSPWRNE